MIAFAKMRLPLHHHLFNGALQIVISVSMLRILHQTDTRRRTKVEWQFIAFNEACALPCAIALAKNAVWRDPSHSGRRSGCYYSAKASISYLGCFYTAHIQMMPPEKYCPGYSRRICVHSNIHRAEVLNSVQALDDHFAPRHIAIAPCRAGTDNHGQHFRRQPHRNRQRNSEASTQFPLIETIDQYRTTGTMISIKRINSQSRC